MSGAAYFAASAAYKSGAGIVRIFTHKENYVPVASKLPEAVYSLYDDGEEVDALLGRLDRELLSADCVVIGCGLGKGRIAREIVRRVLIASRSPTIIDADALNIIAEDDLWRLLSDEARRRTVITPHMGEMSRICGAEIGDILDSPVKYAETVASKRGVICLLKDHKTVITDGQCTLLNQSGNPGMATAGMGDVLAGILGALLSRKTMSPYADLGRTGENELLYRVAVGAYIHGCAGDKAREKVGEYSLVASDLISEISSVICDFCANNT